MKIGLIDVDGHNWPNLAMMKLSAWHIRIYILRSLNYDPYVMIYDKPNAQQIYLDLQRWCNNKIIFGAVEFFEDYNRM